MQRMSHSPRIPVELIDGRLSFESVARVDIGPSAAIDRLVSNWYGAITVGSMPAGYTYLGQFLAHELVSRPGDPRSQRSPLLDLDSIYGSDPAATLANSAVCDTQACFLLGSTVDDIGTGSTPRDLPRQARQALIPEPRNDENMVIGQLHCLILRFHNQIVTLLRTLPDYSGFTSSQLFEAARLYLIATMQEIIINDYLATISHERVYQRIFRESVQYFRLDPKAPLPPEFTAAAFRFGHSMVRRTYNINIRELSGRRTVRKLALQQLFQLTGSGGLQDEDNPGADYANLPESKIIDWFFFFTDPAKTDPFERKSRIPPPDEDFTGYSPLEAMLIDPGVIPELRRVPSEPGVPAVDIVLKNLFAGTENRLPSGQEVATEILRRLGMRPGLNELSILDDLKLRPNDEFLLKDAKFLPGTPLWLYLLVEASTQSGGTRLGPLGSLIVCEIIRNAIANQQATMTLSQRTLVTDLKASGKLPRINSMFALITSIQGAPNDNSPAHDNP